MGPSRPILRPITRFWNNPPSRFTLLEHATGAAGATEAPEVVSRTVPRSPPSTRAGGQDDGSYTNSIKQKVLEIMWLNLLICFLYL